MHERAAAGVDLLELFLRFLALSMLSVGGAVSVAPEMHRYLVEQRHWLTDGQFTGRLHSPRRPLAPMCCSSRSSATR